MNINYRNARDELKHRIVIDKSLEAVDIGGSVVITDYSVYDPDNCFTGGAYWFSTQYKKISSNKYLVYYRTSAKFRFCSKCGTFSCNGCCGNRKLISQAELIKLLQKADFSPDHEIEYLREGQ